MKPPRVPKTVGVVVVPPAANYHTFDFTVLDGTPGGGNLGRIEWRVEPFPHSSRKRMLGGILVWASQTRDPLYARQLFWLPRLTAGIHGRRVVVDGGRSSFMQHVWHVGLCEIHGGLVFSAYPENHHRELYINLSSSISIDLEFRP